MRTLVVFLSLGLFFLTGLVIGLDHDETRTIEKDPSIEETENSVSTPDEKKVMIKESSAKQDDMARINDSQDHITQKMASFLESAIKGFYDLFINIMYKIAQVFF